MWDELDRVPWKRLRHNYGDAAQVPALLRRCAEDDADQAGEALDELDNLLYHQGGWICPAASAALPFLVDLATGTAAHHRAVVVALIGRFVHEASIVQARVVDPDWPETVEREVPRMLSLLADPDPRVRREATWLVSRAGLPHEPVLSAMWQRWRAEQDRVTRWDLALAFGDLLARDPGAADVRSELHALLDSETNADTQLALAALHALAGSEPELPPSRLAEAVAAIRHDDAAGWQDSAWFGGGSRQVIANATGQLMRRDPARATSFALAVARDSDHDERIAGLAQAADLLAEWRAVAPALLDFLIERLSDDEAEVRFRAAYLLGCVPDASAPAAGRLAELVTDAALRDSRRQVTVGDGAVWALARLGDPRCLPAIADRLGGPRLGFAQNPEYMSAAGTWPGFWLPSVDEVLAPLRAHAAHLLPYVLPRLADADNSGLAHSLCRLLGAWGAASAPAVPLLLPLLDHDEVGGSAARALGGIGPAAAETAPALRRRAEAPAAAWAHWRVTGDPAVALSVLARRLDADPRHETLRELGELERLAAGMAERVRQLAGSGDDWVRVEAAYAHCRITGDPAVAVPVLTEVVRPLSEARCLPVMINALERLARIGAPAAPAVPIARAVRDSPRRLSYFGGWRVFAEDERLRAAATVLAGPV
ncbi:hypothetical protein AB0J86_26165 [Micromonospora sp. NPDC049559]|uniref:hypothetical protein n=1 Tax=Micromonospora sp. NPDC049559 TaxID=3155923 RepID=UPI0034449124